ncbi:succinate dehydrogenase, cytochrome b556 subunit [bacterium]|nr:succinate dehydrogenase, cytochrome b556 subunit [bacterium]
MGQPSTSAGKSPRPLSPHIGIYRWQISMTLSILHRISGVALAVGLIPLTIWLWSAAYSPDCYNNLVAAFAHPVGRLCLLGWTLAFYYHLCNGIRHLFWDAGKGFSIPVMTKSGVAAVLVALLMTIGTWWCVFNHANTGAM